MATGKSSYRYLLRLLPQFAGRRDQQPSDHDLRTEGWELVSERITDDGSELVMFRRKA
jgi:hypothetical protein